MSDGTRSWRDDGPLRVGISSCLLGEEVRWDGGHKRDRFLTDLLGSFVEWVPVCPEVEAGMTTPREPVHLRPGADRLLMIGTRSGEDWTRRMETTAARRARELEKLDLCGYVLKKGSPSCGMERVKVRPEGGMPSHDGRGLFASALMKRLPRLPVEEEGRLNDAALRENFIERLFAYRRMRALFTGRWSVGNLVAFHTAHKLQLMAHSQPAYLALGRLVADAKNAPRAELREHYQDEFTAAFARLVTRPRHVNVLQHCVGYFRKHIDADARAELAELIEEYRAGLVPLIVPITLIAHYTRRLGVDYLAGQIYLQPHPRELMLRNHA